MSATPPTPPSSLGRYVRAVVGVVLLLGGLTIGILEALAALHGATITIPWVALAAVMVGAGYLLTDPSAIQELPALIRAWRQGP